MALTEQQIRRAHAISCGRRIYKECRYAECSCACHSDDDEFNFHLDMLEHGDSLWNLENL